jgi:HAD superfamily hydrolase (TIGR01549 family)
VAVRAVVFDLFDTLVDLRADELPSEEFEGRRIPASARRIHAALAERVEVDFGAFHEALMEGVRAFGESHYAKHREVPTFERFSDLLGRVGVSDPELAERMTQIHMAAIRAAVRVPRHHREVLDALRARVRTGVCSNFSHSETALGILDASRLGERMDAVVVSDAVGWRKPHAGIFEEVLTRLDVASDEVLHVGDSLRADVGGAAALGIRTVWITRRVSEPERSLSEHEGPPPDHAIRDLAELPALLDALGA